MAENEPGNGGVDQDASHGLATPIHLLGGVSSSQVPLLQKLQLRTAADVLFRFPRTYQDLTDIRAIGELEAGVTASVCGTVAEVEQKRTSTGKTITGAVIHDSHGASMRVMWFNQPFIRSRLQRGKRLMFSGKPKLAGLRWEFVHPRIQPIEESESGDQVAGEILPVYPLTEGVKQNELRYLAKQTLADYVRQVEEVLPEEFVERHKLWSIHQSLMQIHFPSDQESLEHARRRFVFQELLVLQLALAIRRNQTQSAKKAEPLETTAQIDARIRRLFPFEFTDEQNKSIGEVVADIAMDVPMNRLLQGDVGSGKTVVAIYAMLVAAANGYQAAIMAPTEVLARQHFETLGKALSQARVRLALWTGSQTTAERRQALEDIQNGNVDLIVGTQALLHADCEFPNLRLVVVDEQHKFGVQQRARLRESGVAPHYLVMTATPIPRTVAMTAFGDLDTSSIEGNPPGRQEINSYLVPTAKQADWWGFFRKQLRSGRQGYVIVPRLEESESQEIASLVEMFESLCNDELEAFRLDLIHGRMSAEMKQTAMQSFHEGRTQVLVATSVIEVGIDVPNAGVMTIMNGERFGLAQLHQMRGRVGRGIHAGYVGVFHGELAEEKMKRLEAFVSTSNGFKLAELDFELRGPGDLLGTKQHGLPPLRIADLIRDSEVLMEVRAIARQLVDSYEFRQPEFAKLLNQVARRYKKRLELGDVG